MNGKGGHPRALQKPLSIPGRPQGQPVRADVPALQLRAVPGHEALFGGVLVRLVEGEGPC